MWFCQLVLGSVQRDDSNLVNDFENDDDDFAWLEGEVILEGSLYESLLSFASNDSTESLGKMNPISSPDHPKSPTTLVIIDFDDTLFPTDVFLQNPAKLTPRVMLHYSQTILKLLDILSVNNCKVVLLTASCPEDQWMNRQINKYFSRDLQNRLHQLEKFYSRETGRIDKYVSFSQLLRNHIILDNFNVVYSLSDSIFDSYYFELACSEIALTFQCIAIQFVQKPKIEEIPHQLNLVIDQLHDSKKKNHLLLQQSSFNLFAFEYLDNNSLVLNNARMSRGQNLVL
jgi:hypothetical protein